MMQSARHLPGTRDGHADAGHPAYQQCRTEGKKGDDLLMQVRGERIGLKLSKSGPTVRCRKRFARGGHLEDRGAVLLTFPAAQINQPSARHTNDTPVKISCWAIPCMPVVPYLTRRGRGYHDPGLQELGWEPFRASILRHGQAAQVRWCQLGQATSTKSRP